MLWVAAAVNKLPSMLVSLQQRSFVFHTHHAWIWNVC